MSSSLEDFKWYKVADSHGVPGTTGNSWVVLSNIFLYVHPYLGKIPILTNIFQVG